MQSSKCNIEGNTPLSTIAELKQQKQKDFKEHADSTSAARAQLRADVGAEQLAEVRQLAVAFADWHLDPDQLERALAHIAHPAVRLALLHLYAASEQLVAACSAPTERGSISAFGRDAPILNAGDALDRLAAREEATYIETARANRDVTVDGFILELLRVAAYMDSALSAFKDGDTRAGLKYVEQQSEMLWLARKIYKVLGGRP